MVVPRARSQEIVDIILFGVIATIVSTVGNHVIQQVLAAERGDATAPVLAATASETLPRSGLSLLQAHPVGGLLLGVSLLVALGLLATGSRAANNTPDTEHTNETD